MRRALFCLLLVVSACSSPSPAASTTAPRTTPPASSAAPTTLPSQSVESVTIGHSYGSDPHQVGDLTIPGIAGQVPVVVLVHGGFWSNSYGLALMEPLAADLNDRGFATWNIEFRRLGDAGGGYPNTLTDVAAAVRALTDVPFAERLDLDRVGVVGHSSGGHLALWLAGQDLGPVTPALIVGQAPVVDLVAAADANLGGGAVRRLLGGAPDESPESYESARPALEDASSRVLIVHGELDLIVPVSQAESVDPALATVFVVPATDHFDVIDPSHPSWRLVVDALSMM